MENVEQFRASPFPLDGGRVGDGGGAPVVVNKEREAPSGPPVRKSVSASRAPPPNPPPSRGRVFLRSAYCAGRTSTGRPSASSWGLTTEASPTTTQTKVEGSMVARAAASMSAAVRARVRLARVS